MIIVSTEAGFILVRDVLATFGITQFYPVSDVQKGFAAYRRYSPDIILIGILKNFDAAIALTKQIRLDKDSPDPVIPIVFMTKMPTRGQFFGSRDAGVSEFLIKPYSAEGMYQKLDSVIEHPGTFVRTEDFFGPDRRGKRQAPAAFSGEERRSRVPLIVDAKEARRLLKIHFQSKHAVQEGDKE